MTILQHPGMLNHQPLLSNQQPVLSDHISYPAVNLQPGHEATSYLAEHDPTEPEVHVADDGERAQYTRRTAARLVKLMMMTCGEVDG